MFKKMFEIFQLDPERSLAVLLGVVILSLGVVFITLAWTEPSAPPPGGNVSAPINVSGTFQEKAGGLGLGGNLDLSGNKILYSGSARVVEGTDIGGTAAADYTWEMKSNKAFRVYDDNTGDVLFDVNRNGNAEHQGDLTADRLCLDEGEGCKNAWSEISGGAGAGVWATSGDDIYNTNSGNVGIGTTNPGALLELSGTGHALSLRDSDNDNQAAKIEYVDTYGGLIALADESGTQNVKIRGYGDSVFNTGNVGIGTTNPLRKLHVYSSGWKARFAGPEGYIQFGPANSSWAHIYTDRPNFIFNKQVVTVGGGFASYATADLIFRTNTNTERMRILNSNGNVGIGTPNPQAKLDVDGWIRSKSSAGVLKLAETDNTNVWWLVADGNYFSIRKNNEAGYPLVIDNAKEVGIGINNPGYKLEVNGNVGADAYYYTSDISLKEDITPLENSLNKVLNLEGVSFKWKENNESSIGLIAQGVEKEFPRAVLTDEGGIKSVDYGKLIAPLIESVKAQQNQIEKLKQENKNQQQQIDQLQQEIEQIKEEIE